MNLDFQAPKPRSSDQLTMGILTTAQGSYEEPDHLMALTPKINTKGLSGQQLGCVVQSVVHLTQEPEVSGSVPGPEVIKLFSCSAQFSMNF